MGYQNDGNGDAPFLTPLNTLILHPIDTHTHALTVNLMPTILNGLKKSKSVGGMCARVIPEVR